MRTEWGLKGAQEHQEHQVRPPPQQGHSDVGGEALSPTPPPLPPWITSFLSEDIIRTTRVLFHSQTAGSIPPLGLRTACLC